MLESENSWVSVYLKAGSQYDARAHIALCHLHVGAHRNTRIDLDHILASLCIVFLHLVTIFEYFRITQA